MRLINKLALLGLLVLPFAAVRGADISNNLTVTVDVSIDEAINVVFLDGAVESAAKTWTLAGKLLNTVYDTNSTPPSPTVNIKNKAGADVTVTATLTGGSPWTIANKTGFAAAKDKYYVTLAGTPTVDLPGSLGTVAAGAVTAGTLELKTPQSVSKVHPTNILITFTASNN